MDSEHEEAMRADFARNNELRARAWRASTPETEMNELFAQMSATNRRWLEGPHREHWQYLDDAYSDWHARPDTMARMLDNVEHNRAQGHDFLTEVEHRSQLQARDITDAERARKRDRPPRQR
ncbi:hypothetical protein F5X71_08410 [Nocardia brasiliensis]|uniref:Uncharacterized protein n=1 Tax=Nocardia brasiliensis TaxID=37326 RepID=A0A6G9XNC0_NOCBR|nr:hypothetical protein [Nocardia brasiliensis]QIS02343.1 hypothetical protein F5X71_08410 [Nocardia brasiliensis]